MTGLNHAATGITIALIFKRPEIALPLALLSHFVLDMVPHSYVAQRKNVLVPYFALEAVVIVIIVTLCMKAFPEYALLLGASAAAACAPDLLWPFYYKTNTRYKPFFKQFFAFHNNIQWSETYRGWLVEVLYFSVLVIFLTTYHG